MVTKQDVQKVQFERQQLTKRRQQLESQRQQLSRQRQQAQQIIRQGQTPTALRSSRQDLLKIQQQQKRLGGFQTQAGQSISRLQQAGKTISKSEKQLRQIQKRLSDVRSVEKRLGAGVGTLGLSGSQRRLFQKLTSTKGIVNRAIKEAEQQAGQSLGKEARADIKKNVLLDLKAIRAGATPTERKLAQSLPRDIRNLPVTEVQLRQSLPKDIRGSPISRVPTSKEIIAQQSLPASARNFGNQIQQGLEQKNFSRVANALLNIKKAFGTEITLSQFTPPSVQANILRLDKEDQQKLQIELNKKDLSVKEFFEGTSKIIKEDVPKEKFGVPLQTPALFATGAIRAITPETIGGAVGTAGMVGAWSALPNLVKLGIGGITSAAGVRNLRKAKTPEEFGGAAAEMGIGGLILAPRVKGGFDVLTSRKPVIKPVPSTQPGVKPFVRQRAVIRVVDKDGHVAYIIDRNTNKLILPGGGIEKGESPRLAAIRELKEELIGDASMSNKKFMELTGIDLRNVKKVDEVLAVPGENQVVFQVRINKLKLNNLKLQSKEAKGLVQINSNKVPKNLNDFLIGKRAGIFNRKSIRSADLVVNARADRVVKIDKTLKSLSPKEKKIMGDLAKAWAKDTFGKGFAKKKGIKLNDLIKDYLLASKGEGLKSAYINPIEQTFTRKGSQVFLKKRVPAGAKRSLFEKISKKKPGTFKKFQQVPQIALNIPSRYNVPSKSAKEFGKFKGEQFFVRGSPGFVESTKGGEARTGDEFKVLSKFFQRGEKFYFFQPPRTPGGEGFLALNYLGVGGKESPKYGFTVFGKTPVIQILKARVGKEVVLTKKALAGKELEVGAPTGSVFKVVTELKPTRIAGKKTRQQIIKSVKIKPGELSQKEIEANLNLLADKPKELLKFRKQVKKQTGIDYEIGFQPKEIGDVAASAIPSLFESRIKPSTPSSFESKIAIPPSKPFGGSKSKLKTTPSKLGGTPSKLKPVPSLLTGKPIKPSKPPKIPPSKSPFVPSKAPFIPGKETRKPSKAPKVPPAFLKLFRSSGKEGKRKLAKLALKKGWIAEVKPLRIKKGGKKPKQKPFRRINQVPTSKKRARDALFWTLDQSLATTGRLKQTNKKAGKLKIKIPLNYAARTRSKFRNFKIVKGKRIVTPNKWIERKGKARLDTLRERQKITSLSLIAQKRKQANQFKPIKIKRIKPNKLDSKKKKFKF